MAGRKEILTEQLARKIAKMIELFPDSQIPVAWESVMAHSKKRFGHGFNRQMLSQKEWNGRKIIAEAFSEAKAVQRRMHNDSLPKYKNAQRSVLHNRIAQLEAKVIALQEELEKVRAQQIDELDAFLNTPRDLRQLLTRNAAAEGASVDELQQKRETRKPPKKHTNEEERR
jgi:phage-related minor tail protein